MICAYDKVYLEKARNVLARMLDFAVYDLKYNLTQFFEMFIKSGVAKRFEKGDFTILAGKSGVEVAYEVLDKMNELYLAAKPDTNLKRKRIQAGFSQRELAELSGVPIRTIQQYEQRQKRINKAQVEYLLNLSKALCCEMECLIEKVEIPGRIDTL